jgi:hypothetical protein
MDMTGIATLLLVCLTTASPPADPQPSVEAGREALDRWVWKYPWYDSDTDGVRPVRVSVPWHVRWAWVQDAVEDFFEWLGDLFRFRGAGTGSGAWSWFRWLAWTVLALLLVLATYLIVRILRARGEGTAGKPARGKAAEKAAQRRRVEALPLGAARKRGDLLDAARQCYQQGLYRDAIIYLFSYQLVRLDKNQRIRLAKGKTNRQYLRELGRRSPLGQLLEHTMVAFEQVFFGNYPIDRTRFEAVWSRLERFETLAGSSTQ